MKFVMPSDPIARSQIHLEMLAKVQTALREIGVFMLRAPAEIERLRSAGQDASQLLNKRKDLHRHELCLRNQERRLQEALL